MTELGTIITDTNSATFDGIFHRIRTIYPNFINDGIVNVSASDYYSSFYPRNLFDGNQETYYQSLATTDKVITIDFHQNSFILSKYSMKRFSNTVANPTSWAIYGITGEEAVLIHNNWSFPISLSYESRLYFCSLNISFSKFELRFSPLGTNGDNNIAFSELEFFGILNPIIHDPHSNTCQHSIISYFPFFVILTFPLYHFVILLR